MTQPSASTRQPGSRLDAAVSGAVHGVTAGTAYGGAVALLIPALLYVDPGSSLHGEHSALQVAPVVATVSLPVGVVLGSTVGALSAALARALHRRARMSRSAPAIALATWSLLWAAARTAGLPADPLSVALVLAGPLAVGAAAGHRCGRVLERRSAAAAGPRHAAPAPPGRRG